MLRVLGEWDVPLCFVFAVFLSVSILIKKGGSHHGGKRYGLIVSIGYAYFGNVLARCSRREIQWLLGDVFARWSAALIGCVSGAVCILVQDCNTRCLRRRWVGIRDVSIWSAEVAMVQNVPKMAICCADSSFATIGCRFGGLVPWKGRYHPIAA